eukprot:1011987-Pleurochrysis_carterae.AAC.2
MLANSGRQARTPTLPPDTHTHTPHSSDPRPFRTQLEADRRAINITLNSLNEMSIIKARTPKHAARTCRRSGKPRA